MGAYTLAPTPAFSAPERSLTEISDFAAASATGSGSFDGHIRPGFAFGALPARASSTLHRTAASKCDMPDLTLMALCCGLLLATRAQELTPDATSLSRDWRWACACELRPLCQ